MQVVFSAFNVSKTRPQSRLWVVGLKEVKKTPQREMTSWQL